MISVSEEGLVDFAIDDKLKFIGLCMNPIGRMSLILQAAFRSRRAKIPAPKSTMIGLIGRAETAIAPEGTIFVRNELWRAHSPMSIAAGEAVRVTGIDGLILDVEAEENAAVIKSQRTAVDD